MKILLSGANGYIGSQLLILLLEAGHEVVAMVRNLQGLALPISHPYLKIIETDLLNKDSLKTIPLDIDIAFYLVHAMSYGRKNFVEKEQLAISNFLSQLKETNLKQIIYLSGLCNDKNLSPHLASRYKTECEIKKSGIPFTVLRAGIIIGSGSASFEIIRDLTEKLPVMVAPKWVNNLCQPIAIEDVLFYLRECILHPGCLNRQFDIGGPDCLSYKEMLLAYAKKRDLKRWIFIVPVLTPRLSSYWLYFVTSVNYSLASSLVDSVKNQAICSENTIRNVIPHVCLKFDDSLAKTLDTNTLIASWKDTFISQDLELLLPQLKKIPQNGCLIDQRTILSEKSPKSLIDKIWAIGGNSGWYYMDWAWSLRGFMDKLFGGVGLKRGRTHPYDIKPGYSLDFWRVILADREQGTLLLYAEMKVPGEAWLEFKVEPHLTGSKLTQTASFRPKGLFGRFYWYFLLPFHKLIFRGMAKEIAKG